MKLLLVLLINIFLVACSEIRSGIEYDKKVEVRKISVIPSNSVEKTFTMVSNDNIDVSLEYKQISRLIAGYLTKMGYEENNENPKYKVLFVYGSEKSSQYRIENGKLSIFREDYSGYKINSDVFLLAFNVYEGDNRVFESIAVIKLRNDDPARDKVQNISFYIDCLIKATFYDNNLENYENPFKTQEFSVFC